MKEERKKEDKSKTEGRKVKMFDGDNRTIRFARLNSEIGFSGGQEGQLLSD